MAVIFVPGEVSRLDNIDPKEIRVVEIQMPHASEVDGRMYPIADEMRPGTAFLAEPFGARTQKLQKRLYTRSNCALTENRILQTIINDTHDPKADTSVWWQTDEVSVGDTINVRVEFNGDGTTLIVYEHRIKDDNKSLKLEPEEWLELEKKYPENFRYHPVLTREWPEDWPYTRGRIVKAEKGADGQAKINMNPLFGVVTDIEERQIRMCGNETAELQLRTGFEQTRIPASFKAEVW